MNISTSETTFARALRSERIRVGLTQAQLSNKIETSQQNVAAMEKGLSLPRHDLYERMVAFFGNTSVIAALPPKRDLLMATEAIGKASASSSAPMFQRRQESLSEEEEVRPVIPEMRTPRLRRERNLTLRELLPSELRGNVEKSLTFIDTVYRVDYLSDKLCVEVKSPVNIPSVLTSARLAMQQLYLFTNVIKVLHPNIQLPRASLVLVKGGLDIWASHDNNPVGKTVIMEAGIMGVAVLLAEDMAQAAKYIAALEKNEHQESTTEVVDAPEDF